ncbi:purple acid phosphatase family protein [Sporolactobacillus vineae]|uniref:purple acid phosphatase family protein n=1 Tax=Sporolactobacillus vineae TaxID=444463 RepID=UPI00028A38FF|nr:metallophosphoesterase family protein [Sporolactobacillus vineae]
MKFWHAKQLGALFIAGMLTFGIGIISPGIGAKAETNQPGIAVTKVVPTFTGDSRTTKGFTWYTSLQSVRSDLQLVKKAGKSQPRFDKALRFKGTSYVSSNSSAEQVHKAEAKGLRPNTEYYYRVGDAKAGIWSKTGIIKTAPKKNTAFTFLELTDPQAKSESEGELAADTFNQAAATVKNYSFMTVTGDFVDDGTVEPEWDWLINNSQKVWGNTTVVPAAGNHERKNNAFIDHFNLKPAASDTNTTGAYYSFTYSNTHFVVLNTNEDSSQYRDFTPAQVNWMTSDIKKAKKAGAKWTVVLIHKGPYTTSNHATDSDIIDTNGVRNQIAPLIGKLGVDLVIQGHDHIYARSKPINGQNQATQPTKITEWLNGQAIDYSVNPDGAVYVIPATAGPKTYKRNTSPLLGDSFFNMFDRAEENHALKYGLDPSDPTRPVRGAIQNFAGVTIDNNKLTVVVYEVDRIKGTAPYVIDQFGIVKNSVNQR